MKKNEFKFKFLIACVVVIFVCIFITSLFKNKFTSVDISDLDLTGIDNLMIVAHPDDEMIWGGGHLLEGKYLVVCITAGKNIVRAEEFIKAMKETDNKYLMLGYPDKTMGKRDNWAKCKDDIHNGLERIINYKQWNTIVTHNPDGEYGHIHHKMTNGIVTQIYNEICSDNQTLYFFGKYYTKENLPDAKDNLISLSDDIYDKKYKIIRSAYKSQFNVVDNLEHMLKYENWQEYKKIGEGK